jgi:hypothetical protein
VTNKEILTKAIQKAIDGGWRYSNGDSHELPQELYIYDEYGVYQDIIFNHDFAKALWPRGEYKKGEHAPYGIDPNHDGIKAEWQYHLQRMVISPDPIKYLGEHLPSK